jgi:5-dehydro-2-deoxygluconokinase
VCVGPAVVELIAEGEAFVPRTGGAAAAVATSAAAAGARIAMAGAAGDDSWGHWLCDRLTDHGVDTARFALVPGAQTPITFVGVTRERYGRPLVPPAVSVADAAALVLTSDSLVDEEYRALAMEVRSGALELGLPVVFEVALQGMDWRSQADAAASANACVAEALLVSADARDAAVMTGESDPERAALALVKAGARLVVIRLGAGGAILRGELRRDVDQVVPNLTGVLVGRLALSDFYPPVVPASLA